MVVSLKAMPVMAMAVVMMGAICRFSGNEGFSARAMAVRDMRCTFQISSKTTQIASKRGKFEATERDSDWQSALVQRTKKTTEQTAAGMTILSMPLIYCIIYTMQLAVDGI